MRFNIYSKPITCVFLTGILTFAIVGGTLKTNAQIASQQTSQTTDAKAIWEPTTATVQAIQQTCAALSGTQLSDCFVHQMQKLGASPQAIAFTRSIDNMGYMIGYRPANGRVSLAHVTFPFRANENQGAYLVNGTPERIDVDNQSLLSQNELSANPVYAKLSQRYSDILMFPGDRIGTNAIVAESTPGGGQRFLVDYKLNDRCHACPQIGTARFAFDFTANGQFLGTKLISVNAIASQQR
jgi:hypothetical protein